MTIYSNEQYAALCAAIAQGITNVKYADKEITYRSLSEMLKVKALMEVDLGISKSTRTRFVSHTKGLQ